MNRRDFLKGASGVAGGAAATGAASSVGTAQSATTTSGNETAQGTQTGNGTATGTATGAAGGATEEVLVGPGGEFVFEPEEIEITPGTTVRWVWESDNHNIVVGEQPEDASWEGTPGPASKTYNTGYTYTHTFETTGTYNYWCQPHKAAGMIGDVVVRQPGAGGGRGEVEPEEMGVPYQAHYVGIATILAIVVSLLFTFFLLKYGESAHTSSPNRK
ncbi:MAG: plastocyanin [Halobacteriales archaeon]|jgi:plastocyanin